MHVTWLISGAIDKRDDGRLTSSLASVRYRVIYVAEHLSRRGHRVDIIQSGLPADSSDLDEPLGADVLVVSKGLFETSTEIVSRARQNGARILLDLCDDHFTSPFRDTCYQLCRTADTITASTPMMAEVIARRTQRQAFVISDPYEAPPGMPCFNPSSGPVKLLWFGHPVNFDTLGTLIPDLVRYASEQQINLHVVTENVANIATKLQALSEQAGPGFGTRFTPWSQEALWRAMDDCDLVVIPSLPHDSKLVKSPNRLVESIRRGRFVVAYPLPSYQPLADCAWLGSDLVEGIRWSLLHRDEVLMRISSGQARIERQFSSARLALEWEKVILAQAA